MPNANADAINVDQTYQAASKKNPKPVEYSARCLNDFQAAHTHSNEAGEEKPKSTLGFDLVYCCFFLRYYDMICLI